MVIYLIVHFINYFKRITIKKGINLEPQMETVNWNIKMGKNFFSRLNEMLIQERPWKVLQFEFMDLLDI